MSAPERGGRADGAGRGQRPSAAPGALPADAASVASVSSRAGGGAALVAAAAPTPGAAEQPLSYSPRAATPGAADALRAGLAALSLHAPGPGYGAAAAVAPATQPAPSSRGAGCTSSPDACALASPDGAVVRGGGVPGQGPAAAAALPTLAGDASMPGNGPPVPVDDDGLPLSAEAAASPFSPPASERHTAFLKLVDSAVKAGLQNRDVRNADFSSLAAESGVPLFAGDSLIVAHLRAGQAMSLTNQAGQAAGLCHQAGAESLPAEEEALLRRAWVVLLAQALPIIQGRMDKGTLLPGRLRKVEEAYCVYEQQSICRVMEQPVPVLGVAAQRISQLMGYVTALCASSTALNFLPLHPWRGDQRGWVQAFVLATLRLIPKTAGIQAEVSYELELVDLIEHYMTPGHYGADFCASVLAVLRSRAVADVLWSRGVQQSAASIVAADEAEFEARQKADLAKRGLRRCALPACGKQEATVLQFRVCGHCQTTRYCCPEHAKQHWKVHKREFEAEEGEKGEGGKGGAAA